MSGKKRITIALTGLNAVDSPGPGVAVVRGIRDCKDFDVRIIGLSYESLEPGIYMEGITDKTYQIPYPSAGSESLLTRLEYNHEKEHIDVLIDPTVVEAHARAKAGRLGIGQVHLYLLCRIG